MAFDWGANGALLFGRRRAQGQHQETGFYKNHGYSNLSNYYMNAKPFDREKEIMVPNLGGFAAISFNYQNAKVSVGYKGDFFFNAMDTGWDQSRVRTMGFFGPYANLSIGF